jgi:type IV pilus assembly protein PilE
MRIATMARYTRGITLIELLTVIVVLAILSSIALPSYRQYLIRSQRAEAKAALLQVRTAQEKFYMQNNRYSNDLAGLPADGGLGLAEVTETGKYDLSVAMPADGQRYQVTASPRAGGGQADDTKCANFSISDRGVRSVSGSLGVDECWR